MTDETPAAPAAASDVPTGDVTPAAAAFAAESVQAYAEARSKWRSLSNPFAVGFSLTLGGLVALALGTAFTNLSTIVIYVVFALFAALGLDPVVRWFEGHHVSRAWAIVIVYLIFALILVGVLFLIVPTVVAQISQFIQDIPNEIKQFQSSDFYAWLRDTFGNQVGAITKQVEDFLANPANLAAIGGGILKIGVGIASAISGIIIVLVLSLYFLAGLPSMKTAFNRLIPSRNRVLAASMTDEITDSIGGYLMGMVILAFFNSVVATLLHVFTGLPFALLMGVVAFVLSLIPLIGSVLYLIVASSVALFTGWVPALIFAVIYLIYMQIEAYVLTPRVMSRAISVPGSLVVIGALVGGTLLGLLGALVAIPVTASILLIIKQIVIPRQDAKV